MKSNSLEGRAIADGCVDCMQADNVSAAMAAIIGRKDARGTRAILKTRQPKSCTGYG